MDITKHKYQSFMKVMEKVANKNHCNILFAPAVNDINRMEMTIMDRSSFSKTYVIMWNEAESQTDAAVTIWADFFNELSKNSVKSDKHTEYCKKDTESTYYLFKNYTYLAKTSEIKDVIFNPPATIVFWNDNTKTVVKTQHGEPYDPEKGLAMAMCKKMLGNKGNYFNVFSKWTKKYYDDIDFENNIMNKFHEALDNYFSTLKKGIGQFPVIAGDGNPPKETEKNTDELPWKIWYHKFDTYGNIIEFGVHKFEYKYKSSATRKAKKLYDKNNYEWIVSKTNPFINDLSE